MRKPSKINFERKKFSFFEKYLLNFSSFSDYGTLLFIRGVIFTQDGRSIVDTIGQQRFRIIDRGMRDGYNTARVQIVHDHPIEQNEFDGLFKKKD